MCDVCGNGTMAARRKESAPDYDCSTGRCRSANRASKKVSAPKMKRNNIYDGYCGDSAGYLYYTLYYYIVVAMIMIIIEMIMLLRCLWYRSVLAYSSRRRRRSKRGILYTQQIILDETARSGTYSAYNIILSYC